jgi:hypothetical protein
MDEYSRMPRVARELDLSKAEVPKSWFIQSISSSMTVNRETTSPKKFDLSGVLNEEYVSDDLRWKYDEELDESLSAQSRLKKAQRFKSRKTVVGISRKMKLKRASSVDVLKRRSKLAARRVIMKRYLRGRNKSQISAQEKNRLESQIRNMPNVVGSLSNKLLPKMRKLEQKRLSNLRKPK